MEELRIDFGQKAIEKPDQELPFDVSDIENSDEMRVYKAKELGLVETASWDQINELEDKISLAKIATFLGLPEDTTSQEITKAEEKTNIAGIGYLAIIGAKPDSTPEEIDQIIKADEERRFQLFRKISEEMIFNRAKNITPNN